MTSSLVVTIPLKVVIDKENKRVIFAEANSEFVDVLFSFLTLPMGTIQRLLPHANIASFKNLYGSMSNLDDKYFKTQPCKDTLLKTRNSAQAECRKLKINIDDIKQTVTWRNREVFVSQVQLLEYWKRAESPTSLELGPSEILKLLEYSILSKTPIADIVFGKEDANSDLTALMLRSQMVTECNNYDMRMTIKVFVNKLNNKILLVQASNDFIDFLSSFLTLPLGIVISLLSTNCAPKLGVANIYQSILDLNVAGYLNSEQLKEMLLYPRLAKICKCGSPIFLSGEDRAKNTCESSLAFPKCHGGFVRKKTMFMVTDDLVVTPLTSTSCISFLQSLEILPSDVEEQEISIGMEDALNMLIASLGSTSVLTPRALDIEKAK